MSYSIVESVRYDCSLSPFPPIDLFSILYHSILISCSLSATTTVIAVAAANLRQHPLKFQVPQLSDRKYCKSDIGRK